MKLICFLVGLSVVFSSCHQPGTVSSQDQIRPGKSNQKYNLEYSLHTMEVTAGSRIIDGVSIRDKKSGEEARFEPSDPQSLLLGDGYVKNISWSPDDEYLILPLGQFEGFCLIKSSEVLNSIREKNCFDTIRIQLKTGLKMSRQFANWDGDSAFVFTAGMENRFPRFRYDFSSRQLSALEKVNDIFEGHNSRGGLAVVR
jgi:hypothetical protein